MRLLTRPAGRLALSLLLLAGATRSLSAASWWRLPVWGAEVRSFAVDPFEAGTVYCGTSRGNFYLSKDDGATWEALRSGPAFPGFYVTTLIADPAVRGRLWASLVGELGGGLLARSDDRGAEWVVLARSSRAVTTRALALAPGDPLLLALAGDDGVRLSADGGRTWSRTGEGVPGLQQVESLAFDPSDRKTLYAGTWRQAFRTRDGGTSWNRIAEGMVLDATVYAWDFDAADSRDIWVSTCGWVYRSHDGGDRWTRFTTGFTNRRSHAVRRDPKRPGVVYAATVGGLHRSLDGGATWSRISRESLVVTALEIDHRSGRLYVGTEGEGVFYSDDAGQTLESGSRGLPESRVSEVAADPNDPERVFFFRAFAGEESGVWQARGREVRKVSVDPLPASASLAAFRGPGGKTVLLVASSSGVKVSRDGGVHWATPGASEAPRGAPIVLFGDAFGAPVLVTTEGTFRTADGARFEAVPGGLRPAESAQLLADRGGDPLLEIKNADGFAYWDGQSWSAKKKAVLGGGIFLNAPQKPVGGWTNLQDVDGTLFWQKGKNRRAFTSPRNGLTLASAAQVSSGRVYLGTMGDGLFVFEP
ncbi:MAG TPA: hypothetical protein VGK26_08915 [Thermoanaerobaculia bacterium]|jgi:photosystem II stability/assembly factor-like uncharacterized protein